MPVEITILSGARQGERIELSNNAFDVGNQPADAVRFDPQSDPGVQGRRASLRLEGGGWQVRSTGASPIIVNHEPVDAPRPLRSGDIVRMSEEGPDFAFTLISRLSAPSDVPAPTLAEKQPAPETNASEVIAAPPNQQEEDLATPSAMPSPVIIAAWVIALPCLVAAIFFLLRPNKTPEPARVDPISPTLSFAHFPAQSVDEEQPFAWRPELTQQGFPDGDLSFELTSDPPEGLQIDSETGTIKWTPTESQGPADYKFVLRVTSTRDAARLSDSETLVIQVNEVNQPPVVEPIKKQVVNLLDNSKLKVDIVANDPDTGPDESSQKLRYQLGPGAPDGMEIDATTGELTWEPAEEDANRDFTVAVTVSDEASEPQTVSIDVQISVISPDPWEVASDKLRAAIYLVGAQPPRLDSFYPLGTACAVKETTLLTSASVATSAEFAKRQQWRVVVVHAAEIRQRQEKAIPVTQLRVHKGFVLEEDPERHFYFDLALLDVETQLNEVCELAGDRELAAVSNEQEVGCLGFTIELGALTRFDHPAVELRQLKRSSVFGLESPDVPTGLPPQLFELTGELPAHAFGSLIIDQEARVLGIYSYEAAPDEQQPDQIHYAPVVTLAKTGLSDAGQEHWVAPEPLDAAADESN
jgi:hypothetical protein